MLLIETHPGGSQYDCLSLILDGVTVIDINRTGSIHVHASSKAIPLQLVTLNHPHELLKTVEHGASYLSQRRQIDVDAEACGPR